MNMDKNENNFILDLLNKSFTVSESEGEKDDGGIEPYSTLYDSGNTDDDPHDLLSGSEDFSDEEDLEQPVREPQKEDTVMATIEYVIANVGVSTNLIKYENLESSTSSEAPAPADNTNDK